MDLAGNVAVAVAIAIRVGRMVVATSQPHPVVCRLPGVPPGLYPLPTVIGIVAVPVMVGRVALLLARPTITGMAIALQVASSCGRDHQAVSSHGRLMVHAVHHLVVAGRHRHNLAVFRSLLPQIMPGRTMKARGRNVMAPDAAAGNRANSNVCVSLT